MAGEGHWRARDLWGSSVGCPLEARWSRDISSDLTVGLLAAGAVGGFGCRPLEAFRGRFDLTLIVLELQMQPNMTRKTFAARSMSRRRRRLLEPLGWRCRLVLLGRHRHGWRRQPRSTKPVGRVQLVMQDKRFA